MNGKKPASLSNLRVYLEKDKKWYDLQEFKILGEKFIRQIAQAFISYAETRRFETYTKVFYSIKVWLNWMVDNQDQHKDFFTQLKKDHLELVLNGQDEWELVLGYYRSHLVNRTGVKPRTKHNYISQLNTFLEHLVANSVVPFVEPLDNIRFMSNSKKSVAEVNRNGTIPVEKLRKIVLDSGVGDEDIELTIDLLISLSEEGVDVENLNEVRDGTLQIINDRLNTIRDAAEKDVISEYRVFREGQKFIESCDMEGAEVASKLETLWLNTAAKNNFYSCGKKLKKLFPHNEIGKSRVLKYIEYRYNGLVPGKWYNCELTPFDDGRFFDETILKRKCGWTKEQARRRLHAGPRLLTGLAAIILIDSSMNTDSCRQLYRDCLRPSSIDGHKELVWWKWRNGGCQLSKDLPIKDKHKISTVKAIEILLETTAALHKNAPDNYKSFCFFTHKMNGRAGGGGNQIMLVSTKRWSIWFKQLQNRYPALQGFNYTWDMIRSSKLIKVSLETNDPTRVKEEGQHKLYSTAMRYVDKLPERIRGERKIREFMEWFQVLTTLNIEDFAKKAGISEKEYNKRAKKIMEDYYDFGGISCKDPTAGFNPEVPKGVFCSDVTKCLKCTGKRDVILGTTENMLSVMQWNERLKEMKIYFAGMPKDLWTQNWLLWEVFTANILANWKEDIQFRPEYRKAQEFLKTEKNPYKDIKFAEAVI